MPHQRHKGHEFDVTDPQAGAGGTAPTAQRQVGPPRGPLHGLRVLEIANANALAMCGMVLADLGAEVVKLQRPAGESREEYQIPHTADLLSRNKKSVELDLKAEGTVEAVLELLSRSDVLIEGFRPGVMERLGLGPDTSLARNPRLIYGRLTGWGQIGPLSRQAGHDLNFIALTGALHALGRRGALPTPPLNLIGNFAGGGYYLTIGVLAGLLEARLSGKGQVVDASMLDGSAYLMTHYFGLLAAGCVTLTRGANLLDSGAPIYDIYECKDGQYVCIAPMEQKHRDALASALGIELRTKSTFHDPDAWEHDRAVLAEAFLRKARDEWCTFLREVDVCLTPVLDAREALQHQHNVQHQTFMTVGDIAQPAPGPRFSRSRLAVPQPPPKPGSTSITDLIEAWDAAAEV
ncbi:CaiB/BaiF CoA transferase family protein [Pseudochelatococcus sp. B33]